MNAVATPGFYATLTPEAATVAREAAVRIKVRFASAGAEIIEIGRDLISVKKAVGHGNFLPWIEAEFGMSESAAQKIMNVARQFGGKPVTVTDLPPSVLYALAAPSTDEAVRDEALAMADAGKPVDLSVIDRLKKEIGNTKEQVKSARQDVRIQKEERDRARSERDQLFTAIDDAKLTIAHQAKEIARLKEDGVIHVFPEPSAPPSQPKETYEQWLAVGVSWWNKGSAEWREQARADLVGDAPVRRRTHSAPVETA